LVDKKFGMASGGGVINLIYWRSRRRIFTTESLAL